MVETFPDEPPGREEDSRCIRWKRIEFGDESRTLLFRHPAMQHEGVQSLLFEGVLDAVQVVGAFCQYEHLAAVRDSALRFAGDCGGTIWVLRQGSERLGCGRCGTAGRVVRFQPWLRFHKGIWQGVCLQLSGVNYSAF